MNHPIYSFFFCLIVLLASCETEPTNIESKSIDEIFFDETRIQQLTGQVLNFSSSDLDSLEIGYVVITPIRNSDRQLELIPIKEDGSFSLLLNHVFPNQQVWLEVGDYYYGQLMLNSDLHIEIDLNKIGDEQVLFWGEGINFSGTDAVLSKAVNQFINYEKPKKSKIESEINRTLTSFISGEEKYEKLKPLYDSLAVIELEFLKGSPSEFYSIFENQRQSKYYADLFFSFSYGDMPEELYKEALKHQPIGISNESDAYYYRMGGYHRSPPEEEYHKMIAEVIVPKVDDKEGLLLYTNELFKSYKHEPFDVDIYQSGTEKFMKPFLPEMMAARKELYLQKLKKIEGSKGDILVIKNAPQNVWKRIDFLEEMLPHVESNWVNKVIEDQLVNDKKEISYVDEILKDRLPLNDIITIGENVLNVKAGYQFFFADMENIEAFLQNTKDQYKGRKVLLCSWKSDWPWSDANFFASIETRKALMKLPLDIVYINVKGYKDPNAWKREVIKWELKGNNIILNEQLSKDWLSYFDFNSYNNYVLIEEDGSYNASPFQSMGRLQLAEIKEKLNIEE